MTKRGLILDGGTGRELERIGAPFRQPEWSALALMEAPEFVRKVHDNYIEAGADVITTNSYAVVPFHIGDESFEADGAMLAARAGRIAREAADASTARKILVAGSLPPVFGSYQPDLFDAKRAGHYLDTLVGGMAPYVDLWLAETQSSLAEARAAREATLSTGKPLWISFTLRDDLAPSDMPEPLLRSNETVKAAAELVASFGGEAMLFNCSMPEVMEAAIETARATFAALGADIQVGVYANAFPSQQDDEEANATLTEIRNDLDPDSYGRWAGRWAASGASIIGGCCGIGVDHIHALSGRYRCV
ncbi:homocysteine S-methyltransferase family protein [Agrobacterium rhizogenes]|uniref:homocysteine S-methyltransferase family protein n=1 Tax=Rhizobium rhizogenes TaxID=359 RepID=UPI000645F591|nr:homocysteine S-methyltransferase family protein [Rhizobium rhizogenes]KAA6488847.1 homocysteine S-methyltransferase family protein [Agrobacterium sp. ICMP 7243]OCJ19260.1 homocysteine methyltransferase [Agrobacterium sp. B133/95]NTF52483.1 homocysteine S-methyltransferase family protein [Rhizobium rhizogenes]NTF65492.1 homocysteine S-methyltransferase family protein [Rhizobium rhizogenes]NTG04496.1 homocysteine S-methyltransferase family protein [Rhizobium rhizogenes]